MGKVRGNPPAAVTPRSTASIRAGTVPWQLTRPLPVFAMPITGRSSSASV